MKKNWLEILVEADELDNKTLKDFAEENGIDPTDLSRRYGGFKIGKKVYQDKQAFSISQARRENNIKKEQLKIAAQRRELNQQIRSENFYETFVEEYVVPTIKPLNVRKTTKKKPTTDRNQYFIFGDIHYLDCDHSDKDITKLNESIVENWDGADVIHLVNLGDSIENEHHTQQQIGRRMKVTDQVMHVANRLAYLIRDIHEKTGAKVNYQSIHGNHDESRNGKKARENGEDLNSTINLLLTLYLKEYDKMDEIYISEFEYQDEIIDEPYHFQHGHLIKGEFDKWMLRKIEQSKDEYEDIRYFFKGHSHKFEHQQLKGGGKHFIQVPAVKSWISTWEKETNNISSSGYVMISHDHIIHVDLGEENA